MKRTAVVLVLVAAIAIERWQAPEQAKAIDVVVQTLDEKDAGPLDQIHSDWSVKLGGVKPKKIAADRILSVRQTDAALPRRPSDEQAILANGDCIAGALESIDSDELHIKPALGGKESWKIPLNKVAGLWFVPPPHLDEARFARQIVRLRGDRDKVYLRQGDVLTGTFVGLTKNGVQVEVDKKEVTIDRTKVAVVTLGSAAQADKPVVPSAKLVLSNGPRLTLVSGASEGRVFQGKTWFDAEVIVPLGDLVSFEPAKTPAVYLSDLKPSKYEFTPYLGSGRRDYVLDGNADEGNLIVQGSTYDKGIGLHAASRLSFDLAGRYREFETWVGLDDVTGRDGSVKIDVLVDGKSHKLGKVWTHRDGIKHLRIDVAKAKELTLVVDFGSHANIQAQVDWIEPRLIP